MTDQEFNSIITTAKDNNIHITYSRLFGFIALTTQGMKRIVIRKDYIHAVVVQNLTNTLKIDFNEAGDTRK